MAQHKHESEVAISPSSSQQPFLNMEASDKKKTYRQTSSFKVHQEYVLSWSNLSVDGVLQNVTGRAAPGELTAIMGPSGCGKSTLLNIIADRMPSNNSISMNGAPRDSKLFRSAASFVAENEILLGCFTVYETLMYAAKLTTPSNVSAEKRKEHVEDAIAHMGLESCRNVIVGDVLRQGIDAGQKRRLNIAIELVARPTILILEEPTAGLDSASAFHVMENLQDLARHGRTVICTLDQPSTRVYELLDNVTFLSNGETVYSGPAPQALDYFQEHGHACPQFSSPADYILDLINENFPGAANVQQLVDRYRNSTFASDIEQDIEADKALGGVNVEKMDIRTASGVRQCVTLLQRAIMHNIRNPGIIWFRFVIYTALSLVVGTMYLYTNDKITDLNRAPLMFFCQAFYSLVSVAVLPFIIEQTDIFARERANGSLCVTSYVVSNFIAALPGIFLFAIVSTTIVVLLADLNSYGWFLCNMFLNLVVAESLMHVIGAVVPHYIIGVGVGCAIYGVFMLAEGFILPKNMIPNWWIWLNYIAFNSYSYDTYVAAQFNTESAFEAKVIVDRYQSEDVNKSANMGILAAYAVGLQIIFALILWKFHTGMHKSR